MSDEKYNLGIDLLLLATEKMTAVSRGVIPEDQRQSWQFKKIYTPDALMRERIRLDLGKVRLTLMRNLLRKRSLSAMKSGHFDSYYRGMLIGNALASPSEELNPLLILEQNRRISLFGPGGIQDSQAITPADQNVHLSQAGYVSSVEGPECIVITDDNKDSSVFTKDGWKKWTEVKEYDWFLTIQDGQTKYAKAERVIREPYSGKVFCGETDSTSFQITPSHRMFIKEQHSEDNYEVLLNEFIKGKFKYENFCVPLSHRPIVTDNFFVEAKQYLLKLNDVVMFVLGCMLKGKNATGEIRVEIPLGWLDLDASTKKELIKKLVYPDLKTIKFEQEFIDGIERGYAVFKLPKSECYVRDIIIDLEIEARLLLVSLLFENDYCCFTTGSEKLLKSIEKLIVSLGRSTICVPDKRGLYKLSIHKQKTRFFNVLKNTYTKTVSGLLCCLTVPGGMLFVKNNPDDCPIWTGNSEKAGVDNRLCFGVKIGSDGKLYQKFKLRDGSVQYVDHETLATAVKKFV